MRTTCLKTMAGRLRTACAARLLPLLLLLTLPAVVQAQYTYTTTNGKITITGYTGSGGAVVIPSTINGLSVTSIGYRAFAGYTSLKGVTIPDSVTSIGSYAFVNCTGLTSVMIGNSVTSIGDQAFNACTGLTNITIGNSVTSIGYRAFVNCTSLASVTIPNSVTTIGDEAFNGCTNLTGIYFKGNDPDIGSYVFYGDNNVTVYYLPGATGWSTMFAGRPTALWNLPPDVTISNVRANQRASTTLVDLSYDFSGTGSSYAISVTVSSDGGASFTVPATHFTGDGVTSTAAPGTGRNIVWDAGADCPGQFSTTMRLKVVVGSAFALSPMFTLDTRQITALTITHQPVGARVVPGASVALSVAATGTPPLCYQWWKDNTLLPGATTTILNFAIAQLSDSGNYRVMVSNDYHVVFSDVARLTVIADPANNSQPKLPSAPPPEPKAASHDSLVIVTHGWQPWCWPVRDCFLPPSDVPWVDDMAKAIQERVSSNWRVDSFKWISDAWTQLPDEALNKARSIGYRRGRELAAQKWQHIHLIGHSAGAGFVQAAAETIKGFSPSTVVHTTFLDPYSGEDLWGRGVYGFAADWADCYFAHDMTTDLFPVLAGYSPSTTEGALSHAHNVDITWLDPRAVQLFFDCQGRPQSNPTAACRQEAWSSHDWPHRFYAATVSGNPPNGSGGYGFPLSKEGSGWGNHSTYPNNTTPVVLSGTPSLTQRLLPWLVSLPIKSIDLIDHVVSDARSVIINSTGFLMSSLPTSPQRQAMDSATQPTLVKSAGTNDPVGVPAWLSIGLTVTNAVNFVTFEAGFTSSNPAQGLLTVYWNTNQIGFLDEEVIQPGLQTYRFRLPSTVADGLHVLGFRLDSFNNMASTVTVTNVATGFAGITEPLVLDVSRPVTNGPALITLTGAPGYNYLMQLSTNLTTWAPLATLVNTNGTVLFADPAVTNSSQRFYRAVLP